MAAGARIAVSVVPDLDRQARFRAIQHYIDGNNDPAAASMATLVAADKVVAVVDR